MGEVMSNHTQEPPMRVTRFALLLTAATTISLAGSAFAAGPASLTFTDPAKDNVSPTSSGDITGVTFSTSGPGTGASFTPKNLLVTLALAAAPGTDGTTQYQVGWSINGCEYYMQYAPGARLSPDFGFAKCGSEPDATGDAGTSFGFGVQPKGNSLVFKALVKDLPNKVKPGMTLSGLNAWADLVDPSGLFGPASVTGPLYDVAATKKTYKLG